MKQVTLRLSEELVEMLKQAAARRGQSLNAWATHVLGSVVDPDLDDDESERVRARLRRAGLLEETKHHHVTRPEPAEVARAKAEAGRGRSLSDLVREGRD